MAALTLVLRMPICLPGFGAYYVLAANSYQCTSCPTGTASDKAGSTEACTACELGHYQSATGELQCIACPPGYFAPTEGLEVCEQCASDTESRYGSAECKEKPMEVWPFIVAAIITVRRPVGDGRCLVTVTRGLIPLHAASTSLHAVAGGWHDRRLLSLLDSRAQAAAAEYHARARALRSGPRGGAQLHGRHVSAHHSHRCLPAVGPHRRALSFLHWTRQVARGSQPAQRHNRVAEVDAR